MRISTRWIWPRRLAAAGVLLAVAGGMMGQTQPIKLAGSYVFWAGVGLALLAFMMPIMVSVIHVSPATTVMIVLGIVFLFALPEMLVFLVTGGSGNPITSALPAVTGFGTSNSWSNWLEAISLYIVPGLLIGAPEMLRREMLRTKVESGAVPVPSVKDSREDGVARVKRLLPGWLAAGAAVATGLYAFLLHFGQGPLAKLSWLQLAVATALAAMFLVPPYKLIARAIWERGIAEVFDPGCWLTEWQKIKADVNDTFS
jgi:hypothetical protein